MMERGSANSSNHLFIIASTINQHKPEQNNTCDGEVFSHWATFKMIMAERAAQCLAKLGLNTATSTVTSDTNILHPQTSEPQGTITTTDSTVRISTTPNDLVTTLGYHRRY